jgi:hypothetical protein
MATKMLSLVRETFLRTYRIIYRIEKKRLVVLRIIEVRRGRRS